MTVDRLLSSHVPARKMVRVVTAASVVPIVVVSPPPMLPTDGALVWQWGRWYYHRQTNTYREVND